MFCLSSHSLLNLICWKYLSETSNDWGCWVFCGWGCWMFCRCILHCSFCLSPSQSSLCSSSFLQVGQCSPHEHFSVTSWHNHCTGSSLLLGWCFCFYSGCGCRGNWPILPCFKQFLRSWPCARPRGAWYDWSIGYVLQWLRVGVLNQRMSFVLGSCCWDFSKFPYCQLVYHYWYGFCSGPYHWHLGGDSGYCGSRCSWIHWWSWG